MSDVREIYEAEGVSREVTGNAPLLLTDGELTWLVAEGRVDVFSVACKDGRPVGARTHRCRVEAGHLLVGYRGEDSTGTALLAVGSPGTRVWQLPRQRLRELAGDSALISPIAGLLNDWVQALTVGVMHDQPPQRVSLLEPGQDARLDADGAASPARGVLWVQHTGGCCEFLGQAELPLPIGQGFFPLASPGWIAAREPASLRVLRTEDLVSEPTLWDSLDRFHQTLLAAADQNARRAVAAERARLKQKYAYERRLARATLTSLAAVAQDEEPLAPGAERTDPLVAACRLVGKRMGIDIQAPHGTTEQRKRTDPVGAVARASGVRCRRVLLAGPWWQQDNGPLVAFHSDDERPLALLPVSGSRYEFIEPVTGARTPLTAANANSVRAFAYCFYRSLGPSELRLRDIIRFSLAGTRADWFTVLLLGLAGGLLGLLVPVATGVVFDRILPASQRGQLLLLVLALTVCALAGTMFRFVQGIAFLRLETRMDGSLEAGVWDRLLNLPATFFRQYAAGDMAYRIMGVGAIRQVLTEVAISSLLSLVFSLVSFALLFYYDVRLALMAVSIFVFEVAATFLVAGLQLRNERKAFQLRGKIGGLVLQLVTGISRLRVAAAENRALAVWAGMFSQQKKLAFRARGLSNRLAAFNAAVPVLASLALFAAVSLRPSESLTLGMFLAFSAAFAQVLYAAVAVSGAVSSALQVIPLYEQAKPVLDALPEDSRASAEPGELSGDIEINNVSFRYQTASPLVLDDVSVQIRPGEFVAFVGPSGAGKSSLLRLLLGFETPTAGSLYFDREDLAGLNLQAVRRQIGVVLQNGRLMPGDIMTNIIGSSLLTQEDAWEAARLSGLAKDIEQMPMGMHTVVNEGESTLSGGQRQRLMIARAVVSKPRMLFFDEATSALDNATQAQVSRSLERLKATRVVVAHRLSTIQNADRIYVMEGGRIIQQGSYAELMNQPGTFKELAQRQIA